MNRREIRHTECPDSQTILWASNVLCFGTVCRHVSLLLSVCVSILLICTSSISSRGRFIYKYICTSRAACQKDIRNGLGCTSEQWEYRIVTTSTKQRKISVTKVHIWNPCQECGVILHKSLSNLPRSVIQGIGCLSTVQSLRPLLFEQILIKLLRKLRSM